MADFTPVGVIATVEGLGTFNRNIAGMNKTIGSVETTANKSGGALSSMGSVLGGAVVTGAVAATAAVGGMVLAIGGLAIGGVAAAANLEQQIANIRSVMSGTVPAAQELQDAILELSINPNLKVNATEAAQAIELLSRNGLEWQDIANGAAQSSITLANATGADFGQAADIATDVMALFNISAADMETAVDGITSVITNSKFSINDYALALAQGGGVAASVGVEFDDFNTTIAAISPLFASGSDAGTSFKTFLQRLIPTTKPAREAMADLGLYTDEAGSAFFDASGNMKSMEEISKLLNQATQGLSEAQLSQAFSTIFGTDAMRAAFGVAQAGNGTFQALQATMADTSAADAVAIRMDTLKGTMEILQGVFEATSIQIGNALMPSVRLLADGLLAFVSANQGTLIPFFEKINEYLMTTIPAAISTVSAFWASTLQPALIAVGEYINTTFIPTISKIGELLTSVLPPAIGIVSTVLSDVFQSALAIAGGYIETVFIPKINLIIDILSAVLPGAIQTASALWTSVLQPALETVTNFITNTALPAYGQLFAMLSELLPSAVSTVSDIWKSTLQPALMAVGTFIQETIIPAFDQLVLFFQTNIPLAVQVASDIWNNVLLPALTAVGEFINTTVIPAFTSLVSYIQTNIPTIQAVFVTAFTVAQATVLAFIETIMSSVVPPLQEAFANITEYLALFDVTWADVWARMGAIVLGAVQVIGAAIATAIAIFTGMATAVAKVVANITSAITNLWTAWDKVMAGITDIISGASQVIVSLLEGDIGGAVEGLKLAWQGILEVVSGVWDAIKATIQLSIGSILALVSGFVEGFVGFFVNLASQLTETTGSMVEDIFSLIADGDWLGAGQLVLDHLKQGFDDKVDDVLGAIGDIVTSISDAFTSVDWGSVGGEIIEGIKQGVDAAKDSLFSFVTDIAKSLLDKAKAAIGISSPSKLFRDEVGLPIMQGWALGIKENAGLVTDAIGNVMTAMETEWTRTTAGAKTSVIQRSKDTLQEIASLTNAINSSDRQSQNGGILQAIDFLRGQGANIGDLFSGIDLSDPTAVSEKLNGVLSSTADSLGRVLANQIKTNIKFGDFLHGLKQGKTETSDILKTVERYGPYFQPKELPQMIKRLGELDGQIALGSERLLTWGDGISDFQKQFVKLSYEEHAQLTEQILAHQKALTDETKKQQQIGQQQDFLSIQDKLLQDIISNGLDATAILGDMALGPETAGLAILEAQTRLQQALLDQQKERLATSEEQLALSQKEAALKSEQQRLKFLQDQQKLIEDINDKGFDQASILGGFQVGVEADMGQFLEVMRRFTTAMITQTEDQLQIASPSRVFKNIGQQTMAGLTQGIMSMGSVPAQAMSSAVGFMTQRAEAPSVTNRQNNTFNTTIAGGMDAAQFQAMLNRSLSNAIQ